LALAARPLARYAAVDRAFRPSTFAKSSARAAPRPTAGCGHAATAGRVREAAGRPYVIAPPAGYDERRPYPLVLVIHGWHTTAAAFAEWFAMERFVDDGALVVYPDTPEGANGVWDVGGTRDLDALDAVIDDVSAAYCVDRGRVLAFGFSYGGKLAHHLGCTRPDRVKAVSVGDGSMGSREVGCGKVPLLVTHRTEDGDELFAWGWWAAERWLEGAGCSRDAEVVDAPHGCRTFRGCRVPQTFCEDTYSNLAWPPAWNHTVREEYRALTWAWFESLP
jgi:polyhydroxybutyrate depolymerase